MPDPTGPKKPSELAKQIAERLAVNESARKRRFSLRDSVVVGGLINGLVVLTVAVIIVAGIFVGVNWLLSLGDDDQPTAVETEEPSGDPGAFLVPGGPTTIPVEDEVAGVGDSTTTTLGGPFVSPTTTQPGPFVTFPPPTTTTTTTTLAATTTVPPPTTTPPTTQPPTTQATTTTSSTTTTSTSTTTTSTSTTTTTLPPTTTTSTLPPSSTSTSMP